jgi:hypothetical protein
MYSELWSQNLKGRNNLENPGVYDKSKTFKLSLCLIKHHAMKKYWGVEVQLHVFLISALDGGEWSASHHGRFTPGEKAPLAGG